jgi:hypothetical protein
MRAAGSVGGSSWRASDPNVRCTPMAVLFEHSRHACKTRFVLIALRL